MGEDTPDSKAPKTPALLQTKLELTISSNGLLTLRDQNNNKEIFAPSPAVYLLTDAPNINSLVDNATISRQATGETDYVLKSSSLPEAEVHLRIYQRANGVQIGILGVNSNAIKGLHIRFPAKDMNCNWYNLYFPGWSCQKTDFAVSSICLTAGCFNGNVFKSGINSPIGFQPDTGGQVFFGADLYPVTSLQGESFFIFGSIDNMSSTSHRNKVFSALEQLRPIPPASLQPNLFAVEEAYSTAPVDHDFWLNVASLAKSKGFKHMTLGDSIWQKSMGAFDPRPGHALLFQSIRNLGIEPGVHFLVARISPSNRFYGDAGMVQLDSQGRCEKTVDGSCLWETTPTNSQQITSTYAQGLAEINPARLYLDGFEELMGPTNAIDYLLRIKTAFPDSTLQTSIFPVAGYPIIQQQQTSDRWSVERSVSPLTYSHDYAIPSFLVYLRMGAVANLGWVPPFARGTEQDYEFFLNASLAFGAPLTLQLYRSEVARSDLSSRLSLISNYLANFSQLEGMRELVHEAADHTIVRTENNITLVGLFGDTTGDLSKNALHGRSYAVDFREEAAFFNGAKLTPQNPQDTLSVQGSRVVVPTSPLLNFKNGLTVEAWYKIEDPNTESNYLVEMIPGFGLFYSKSEKAVGGHLSMGSGNLAANVFGNPLGSAGGPQWNQWNHVAYTYDALTREVNVYTNGVGGGPWRQPENFIYGATSFSAPLFIGRSDDPSFGFKGGLKNVKLYSRALTSTEIRESFERPNEPKSELVGWWPLKNLLEPKVITIEATGPIWIIPLTLRSASLKLRWKTSLPNGTNCSIRDGESLVATRPVSGNYIEYAVTLPPGSAIYQINHICNSGQ